MSSRNLSNNSQSTEYWVFVNCSITIKRANMNQAAGSKSKKHAMWDEQNLAENEKIKAELAPVKITEPKTPYHQPLSHLDAELGLEPLALDENIDGRCARCSELCAMHQTCQKAALVDVQASKQPHNRLLSRNAG